MGPKGINPVLHLNMSYQATGSTNLNFTPSLYTTSNVRRSAPSAHLLSGIWKSNIHYPDKRKQIAQTELPVSCILQPILTQRKLNHKGGAFAFDRDERNAAAVGLHNFFADSQPQTRTS